MWRPRPWRLGPGRGLACAALVALLALRVADPLVVQDIRLAMFDVAQRLWPRPFDDARVRIVAIDGASLSKLGQWPWPRRLVADLVRRIAAGKPRALGIDILFPEPDRMSPSLLAQSLPDLPAAAAAALAGLPTNDQRLAAALATVPTVLGVAPREAPAASAPSRHRFVPIREAGGNPLPFTLHYRAELRSLPELDAAARATGWLGVVPDVDGLVRRVPLIVGVGGRLVPSFAMAVLRVAAGRAALIVTTGHDGIDSVALDDVIAPTDRRGRAILDFAPPLPRYISAAELLDPAFDVTSLDGKIVLLAVTGLGLRDLWQTPVGMMQGIEVHAQMIESILLGNLLQRPHRALWIELAAMLAAGLILIWLVGYERPLAAGAAMLAVVGVCIGGEFTLFRFAGWLLDGVPAAATAIVTFAVMLDGNLRAAQAARRRLAAELDREREIKARLDGELTAARAIQMGLLPRRFPAFPERRDIDIYARIEPARAVGGDLFDFLLIAPDRLFFLIADVSGKGIPAALFMAMTKEVVRDAAREHASTLGAILDYANGRTEAASAELPSEGGDMMFVTAFAGILDLASGALEFVSAGHDSPFVLAPGGQMRQLATEGGPPLGALADFPYPVDRDRLQPGEILLLYTDGVTEATDGSGALYSGERLAAALATAAVGSAREAVDGVFTDVARFTGDAEPADDITVLALRRVSEP